MTTLKPYPDNDSSVPRYKVSLPETIQTKASRFPPGFPPDYPAACIDTYAREILSIAASTKGEFHIVINLQEFTNTDFNWLPYTLAIHAITLTSESKVFFEGMRPDDYSREIDMLRPMKPLNAIHNFVVYLSTPNGDRPKRVFEQQPDGSFVSLEKRLIPKYAGIHGFDRYYLSWLVKPYMTCDMHSSFIYCTHPFDHIPVCNLTEGLRQIYATRTEMVKRGVKDPDIEKAVFMHDQMQTVVLRPYWRIDDKPIN